MLSQEETHDLNKASCHKVCSSRARSCGENSPATHNFHSHSQEKADGTSKQPYIQLLIYQIPLPFSLLFVHMPQVLVTLTAVLRPWRSGVFNMRASNTSSDSLRTYNKTAREKRSSLQCVLSAVASCNSRAEVNGTKGDATFQQSSHPRGYLSADLLPWFALEVSGQTRL